MNTSPLIRVTFLLAEDRPPFRQLWEGDLPQVPDPNEPIAFNDRIYKVMERSWRFGTERVDAPGREPIHEERMVLACGILLTQIGGPAHVVTALS